MCTGSTTPLPITTTGSRLMLSSSITRESTTFGDRRANAKRPCRWRLPRTRRPYRRCEYCVFRSLDLAPSKAYAFLMLFLGQHDSSDFSRPGRSSAGDCSPTPQRRRRSGSARPGRQDATCHKPLRECTAKSANGRCALHTRLPKHLLEHLLGISLRAPVPNVASLSKRTKRHWPPCGHVLAANIGPGVILDYHRDPLAVTRLNHPPAHRQQRPLNGSRDKQAGG